MSRKISERNKQLVTKAIQKHPNNMHEAARYASMRFESFKYRAIQLGIYNPNPHCERLVKATYDTPLHEILEGKHPCYNPGTLKRRLFNSGIKQEKCEECGLENKWNGKPLVLQLDHIDGNSSNHHIDNLQILCPNCHTQTSTWGQKNQKSKVTDEQILRELKHTPYITKVLANLKMSKSVQNYNRVRKLLNSVAHVR